MPGLEVDMFRGAGLGALIVQLLEARTKSPLGAVRVKWAGQHDFYVIPDGVNLFDALFESLPPCDGPTTLASSLKCYHAGTPIVGWTYLHPRWPQFRRALHAAWLELCRPRQEVMSRTSNARGMVGAIYRTEAGVAREQLLRAIPPLEDFAFAVEEEAAGRDIWLCAHAEEVVQWCRDRWGARVHFSSLEPRSALTAAPHAGKGPEHVRNALAEILTLSTCDSLVHGVSSMATTALSINPTMPHKFIQWQRPLG